MPDLTESDLARLESLALVLRQGEVTDHVIDSLAEKLPAMIEAARELQRLRCAMPSKSQVERGIGVNKADWWRGHYALWKRLRRDYLKPCEHAARLEDLRAVLSDLCGEAGSTLAELERLREIEARAKHQLAVDFLRDWVSAGGEGSESAALNRLFFVVGDDISREVANDPRNFVLGDGVPANA